MFEFDSGKKRNKLITLQLAPMIDIFTLIIVFLIKGTVLEENAIVKPEDVKLAQSISKESSQVAPQVIIAPDSVYFKMIEQTRPIAEFAKEDFNPRDPIFKAFKDYIAANKDIEGALHINVIGDQATSYKIVYNVSKILRISGFESLLFVAEGEGAQ